MTKRSAARRRGGPTRPSPRSLGGLDWLNFFIANVQTGFGPFIAVYLTAARWTQVDIGLVLTVSGIIGIAGQIPAGVLIDASPSKRLAAAIAIVAIAGSALALAATPIFPLVLLAEVLHGVASCLLGPAIAAISLGLVAPRDVGQRLGRNARFASFGNGIAAAVMGACGRFVSNQAVFFLTAALTLPALLALRRIRAQEIDPRRACGGLPEPDASSSHNPLHGVVDNPKLLIFAACIFLFQLANGSLLPLMGGILTMRSAQWATMLIAACVVVPQIVVAGLSPWVGREAGRRGRRRLLIMGFAALPLRGLLFAVVGSPYLLVVVQLLDGISAAVIGVLLPLVVADVTRGTGRFNAALGTVGTAGGIGGALSTTLGGYLTDLFGSSIAFVSLAGVAGLGLLLVALAMPETRQPGE